MSAPFAALEARVNQSVFERLANAEASLNGGAAVRGIFDNGYAQTSVGIAGMATLSPSFTLATSDVPASPAGASLVVNGATYTVVEHQPDGTGVSVLHLER